MALTDERLIAHIRELAAGPNEGECVEFKENKFDPEEIGENISAISNSAALLRKTHGYLIWGVRDSDHELVGTTFRPRLDRVRGQEVENWLATQLHPQPHFLIHEADEAGRHFVLFEIPAATHTPVRFKDWAHIRIGSYTKKLRDHPEVERSLWAIFSHVSFEEGVAAADITSDAVLELLDFPGYFRLTKQPIPDNRTGILERLIKETLIRESGHGRYHVTNLGAVLFARNLSDFPRLARKAIRIINYKGDSRVATHRELSENRGFASGFEDVVRHVNDLLPQNEEIGQAIRKTVPMYPELAVRELVANAVIHQDFAIGGAGPMVEIFSGRMEISNPGRPLIDPLRFIDEPPRSRNESLAALMRRVGICEERGSGIDKVVTLVEAFQLPAPDFRATEGSMIAVLYGPRVFSRMDRGERIRACYQHACLCWVSDRRMSNASLRQRLGIKDSNYPLASRIIRDAIEAKLIRPSTKGPDSDRSYVPFWA